jgi:hypothetical protein
MGVLRRSLRFWWLLPLTMSVLVGLWWHSGTEAIRQRWAVAISRPPAVEYPTVIELGERTASESVVSRFEIRNRGGQELLLDQVRASCSCSTFEREVDGTFEPVQELRVPPGESVELALRLNARTLGAGTFQKTVSFLTNDPTHPEGQITLVFTTRTGGVQVRPGAVAFGTVPIGREARRTVEVSDPDLTPQTVARVTSADPDRVAVRWVPAGSAERSESAPLLGRLELTANTARPSLLDTAITVAFTDPKIEPLTVRVTGRVAPRVQFSPEAPLLPVSSGDGPVYAVTCAVRCQDNRPIGLELESASPGLSAELPTGPDAPVRAVQIRWQPGPGDGPGVTRKTVRLRVKMGAELETVEIPVTCDCR